MVYTSGYFASQATSEGQPSDVLSQRVNEPLAEGSTGDGPPQ
jgi:hypothetical protein